jgi:hypothetical protein
VALAGDPALREAGMTKNVGKLRRWLN